MLERQGQPRGCGRAASRPHVPMSGYAPRPQEIAMRLAAHKLPIRTRFVVREEPGAEAEETA